MTEMFDIFSTKVTHLYEKSRSTKPETARILVTVKARPEPSEKYGETVCVAGIRLGTGSLHWVRLYPIPFRRIYIMVESWMRYLSTTRLHQLLHIAQAQA